MRRYLSLAPHFGNVLIHHKCGGLYPHKSIRVRCHKSKHIYKTLQRKLLGWVFGGCIEYSWISLLEERRNLKSPP
jgi:hypothetical protein